MTAAPKIDQAGKPAGVAGRSRDDLDLFTVPGTEIVLTDTGTSTSWVWSILDQPPGASATLSAPTAQTTNLSGVTVPGSYLVQLVTDGGALPGQVARIIAAVQISIPTWAGSPSGLPLRIPASGETIEFNSQSSPAVGTNSRGWAQEMDQWFRAIANFGFGVVAQDNGVTIGSEPFYTLNFLGANISDAGSGVLDVAVGLTIAQDGSDIGSRPTLNFTGVGVSVTDNPGLDRVDVTLSAGSGGMDFRNEGHTWLPDGPFVRCALLNPSAVASNVYEPELNAVVQPFTPEIGPTELSLIVTNSHHQNHLHSGGILLDQPTLLNRDALACEINTGSNPMSLGFQALSVSGPVTQAVADGAVISAFNAASLSLPATTGKQLKLICLRYTNPSGAAIAHLDLATAHSNTLPVVLTDTHKDFPDGDVTLTIASGMISLNSGAPVVFIQGAIVRVFDASGYYWVDVFCAGPSANGSEVWTITASHRRYQRLLKIATIPYWLSGAVSTWGVSIGGVQRFIDERQFGAISAADLQDDALRVTQLIAQDLQWEGGVAFTHEEQSYANGLEKHINSFALVPASNGSPLQPSTSLRGGVVWANGRRYVVGNETSIAGFGLVDKAICIAARIYQQTATVVAFEVSSGNPIAAIRQCILESRPDAAGTQVLLVPLYFGKTNVAGTQLLASGRIDLRRDVAHFNAWTVSGRDPSIVAFTANESNLGAIPQRWSTLGKKIAEFGSLASAAAWHGALTGTDNLTPLAAEDNITLHSPPFNVRVIGDTLETFPVHLRSNALIEGSGNPCLFIPPSNWWASFGVASYAWSYLSIGDPHSVQRFVWNVTIRDLTIVGTYYDHAVQGAGASPTGLVNVWAGDYNNALPNPPAGWELQGTAQHILIENVGFDLSDVSNLNDNDYFSAVKVQDVTGPNQGGQLNGLTIRGCKTPVLAKRTTAKRALNIGVQLRLSNSVTHSNILIEGCRYSTNTYGVLSNGLSTQWTQLKIERNTFETTKYFSSGETTLTYGILLSAGSLSKASFSENVFSLLATATDCGAIKTSCVLTDVVMRGNHSTSHGTQPSSAGVSIYASGLLKNVCVTNNTIHEDQNGVLVSVSNGYTISGLDVSGNILNCTGEDLPLSVGVSISGTFGANLKVADNSILNFGFSVLGQFSTVDTWTVQNNSIATSALLFDSIGVQATVSDAAGNIAVAGNTIGNARVGIGLDLVFATAIKVESNRISGQLIDGDSGATNSKGIHVKLSPTVAQDVGVSIVENTIKNCYGYSSTDTVHSSGIVVQNTTEFAAKGLRVCSNDVTLHEDGATMSTSDFEAKSGILILGPIHNLQINSNKITNKAIRVKSAYVHGGVCIMHSVSTAVVDVSIQINDNHVTWCDASFVDRDSKVAAGIFFDCPSSSGVQIANNKINIQSITGIDLLLPGSVHGILLGKDNGAPRNAQIVGNSINALSYAASSSPRGICGCAIWLLGPVEHALISGNSITGCFCKSEDDDGIRQFWGIISVVIGGDLSPYIYGLRISDNYLLNNEPNPAPVGTYNLSNGIRVGSDGMHVGGSESVAISNNNLFVALDGTLSDTLDPGAISTVALNTDASVGARLQVSGNTVERINLSATGVHGIINHGWRDSHFSDNSVTKDALGTELYDRSYTGATISNTWTDNRAGTVGSVGTTNLATPPYKAQTSLDNWTGGAFV